MKRDRIDLPQTAFGKMIIRTESAADIVKNFLHPPREKLQLYDKLPSACNIAEFKVISPFYDRNKVCKAKNCLCPYHKRIREETFKKKYRLKNNKQLNSTISSPTKYDTVSLRRFRVTHKPTIERQKENQVDLSLKQIKSKISPEKQVYKSELDDFMNLQQRFLERKQGTRLMTQHVVKVPVRQIFDYLYQHLDQDRDCIERYLNGIVKDRDLSDFYLERFEDLKQRRALERQRTRLNTIISKNSNKSIAVLRGKNKEGQQIEQITRKVSRNSTRIFKSISPLPTRLTRKTNKKTALKLMIEDLIQNVQEGEEVNPGKVSDFAVMKLDLFEDNYNYLKKKIDLMDPEVLRKVKEKIIRNVMEELKNDHRQQIGQEINHGSENSLNQEQMNKWSQYRKPKKEKSIFFNEQFRKLQNSVNQAEAKRADLNPRTVKQRMMAQLLDLVNHKLNLIQQQSKFQVQQAKDKVNSIHNSKTGARDRTSKIIHDKKQILDRQEYKKSSFARLLDNNCGSKDQKSIEGNFIPQKDQAVLTGEKKIVTDKHLKLGKYRKLSYQGFYRQSYLGSDKQLHLIIPKLQYDDKDQINPRLSEQSVELEVQWKKIKQLQKKISVYNIREIVIQDQDSLFTVKRKARVLKQLLKEEVFEEQIKKQMTHYVALIQQFQLIKNHRWAAKKLGDMVQLQDNGMAQIGQKFNQEPQCNPTDLIKNIFSNYSWLVFYDLAKTEYKNTEVIFENRFFHLMEKDSQKAYKNMRKRNSRKYSIPCEEKTIVKTQQKNNDNLVQIGLKNQCESNLLFSESINHRSNHIKEGNKIQPPLKILSPQQSHSIINLVEQFSNALGGYQYYL